MFVASGQIRTFSFCPGLSLVSFEFFFFQYLQLLFFQKRKKKKRPLASPDTCGWIIHSNIKCHRQNGASNRGSWSPPDKKAWICFISSGQRLNSSVFFQAEKKRDKKDCRMQHSLLVGTSVKNAINGLGRHQLLSEFWSRLVSSVFCSSHLVYCPP